MRSSLLVPVALAAALLARSAPASAAPVTITAEEYKLYKDYQAALTDERVQKTPEKKRLAKIAGNFKVSEKALQAAIDKGEKEAKDAVKASEAEVRALLEAGPLKGRIQELSLDDRDGLVVTYVSWKNVGGEKLEDDACYAAIAAAKGAPISSTIGLWAVDAVSSKKVFQAKIGGSKPANWKEDRIPMFCAARYMNQFEDVKNAYKGNPPPEN